MEKHPQDFRALVISFRSDFRLRVHLKKPAGDHAAFHLQLMQRVAKQRATRGAKLIRAELRHAAPGQILARDPLRHEAHTPGANVLVGAKDVTHTRVLRKLPEEQVGLIHAATCRKRPVGADAFARHPLGVHDARIGVAARRDQPPEPGE